MLCRACALPRFRCESDTSNLPQRLELNYGMQKHKEMVPLMLEHGYEATGWLGLILVCHVRTVI
jgi:hypothetical protein